MNKKFGFTLAEVLITLAIIGIVAALTIPSLLTNYKNREIVTKLKKIYSVLYQATLRVDSEFPVSSWDMTSGPLYGTKEIFNYYKPYFHISRDCGCSYRALGCWSEDETLTLSGEKYRYSHEYGIGETYCAITLNDGTNVVFDTWRDFELGVSSSSKNVFFFYVDVNGDKKPNQFGRDVFQFVITQDRKHLVPAGADNDSAMCSVSNSSDTSGIDCAFKVLKEDKISY